MPEFAFHLRRRRMRRLAGLAAFALAAVLLAMLPALSGAADRLAGAEQSTLVREPQLTPGDLGDGALDGLQYADPVEGLDLVAPPQANNQGNAELSHPLSIPAGRAGVQPELAIGYDSGGGSGWLGTGWDLSVGEITIDTRWGVPRYKADKESETYLLDGDVLSPTAVRSTLQARVAERSDFTRRIETEYERIVRHGDSPKNYWWEVTDKSGTIRWYGGFPDGGGPKGQPGGTRDPSAILSDEQGNAYRWALSAQRDVGVNTIRYFYETVEGERVGAEEATVGKQLYLKRILYTGASPASGEPDDPAYEVRFLRDGDIEPAPADRKDVVVSARGGFLEVTSDLLRRIEVHYGAPTSDGSPRTHDILSRRFDLAYFEGAFGKTLLKSVDQVGSDGVSFARHTFDYYDEVRDSNGAYDGFETEDGWNTGDDELEQTLLNPVEISSLGASETNSGDAHAYIGFNPSNPTKTGSFGGSIAIKGGATEALAEMMDINGDLLPDKVFREERNGPVRYRLNTSGPDGGTTFDETRTVGDLRKLSTDWDVGVGGGPEAFFGASVQFNIAATFSVGEDYFTDVNNDGLPDFVSAGKVRFNHLEEVAGQMVPSFTDDSSDTSVPIDDGSVDLPAIQALADLEAQQREQSPLQDVVRRWVAPFAGTVKIEGDVTLDPPPDTRKPPPAYDGDGVRVAIQRGDDELWTAGLTAPGAAATPAGVGSVTVGRGQAIYFRTGSVDDGARDQVRWSPKVQYTSYAATADAPVADVNGLSQAAFDAAADFTLAGRPDTTVMLPLKGEVQFDAVLRKTAVTTDDVTVTVLLNNAPVVERTISADTVSTAGIDVSERFNVSAPGMFGPDKLVVRIAADSPIDVTKLEWAPRLYYLSAESEGKPVPVVDRHGDRTLELEVPADIDIYPHNTLSAPAKPWRSDLGRTVTVHADVTAGGDSGGGDAVLTVKQRDRLVAKKVITLPDSGSLASRSGEVDVQLASGQDYWFDVSIRSPRLSEKVIGSQVELRWDDGGAQTRSVPHVRNWAGPQGYFPVSYRGWGFAGYRADGTSAAQRIDQDAFVFRQSDFPTSEPTGFDDAGYSDPAQGDAYAFTPFQLDLLDADEEVVDTVPVWRGVKDNLVGGAGFVRSSRTGVDSPAMAAQAAGVGAGARGVRRFGVSAPAFAVTAGFTALSGSFGAGPSFGLLDYTDLNGDAFPDVVAPGYVQYTGPRGGYVDSGDGVTIVGQDFTFAVGGGFAGSAVEIKGNSKGDANTAQDTAPVSGSGQKPTTSASAGQGDSAADDQFGFKLGGAFGVSANFTNPTTSDPDWNSARAKLPAGPGALEEELADVNGDGLPDKVAVDANGVRVRLNLGYRFATDAIRWAGGGFESGEAYSGSVGATLGFQFNNKEFAGGLAYNEGIDMARYSWVDVDGDGVLDRLHKSGSDIMVAFGTGAGVLPAVKYGDMAEGVFDLVGDIPTGQQIAQGRSRGLGGGFDFTIGIGPLCLPAPLCYIIVNPGVHFDHSVSTTQIQLTDIDGDGYPDSLFSNADNQLDVRLNKRGRTNLLRSVTNPIGGEIRLGYKRDGNTTAQPYPKWLMSRVEVDDNRAGDGPDTLLTTYDYSGNAFNSLEREFLGFDRVVERQRDFADDDDPSDDPLLRSTDRRYRNGTVFDGGLVTSETLRRPDGSPIKETVSSWSLVDLATGEPADLEPSAADPAGLRLLRLAVGPVRTKVEQRFFDGAGALRQNTWNTFEYDELGNVVRQVDVGEPELSSDDLVARTSYSNCETSTSDALKAVHPCPATAPQGAPVSPLWDAERCSTWVSLPATFEVRNAAGNLLRRRDGRNDLCDNSTVTRLEESVRGDDVAVTELSYDAYGSYAHIEYPENADGDRYTVDYVYDPNSDTDVAEVTDSHGLTAKATYDGRTGRIASRTDANGQATSYTYDAAGRLASITGPYEQGGQASASFEYRPGAPRYAHAIARNHDAFHAGDTIDTVAFVDGIGRETQTKQDATVFRGAGIGAEDVMVVAGAVEFDALGRPVKEWYPTEEPLGTIGAYNTGTAAVDATVTTWDLADRATKVVAPGNRTTTIEYGFGGEADFGATVFSTTVVDAEGKPQRSFTDVRDNVLAVDDLPAGAPRMRTRYDHDPLGRLTGVIDSGGNTTTHTYDRLDQRTSTRTPDGGLLEKTWDLAGNLVTEVDPNLRASGGQIGYRYDFERLVAVDYSDDTPDVAYEYGDAGAAGRGAGRVVGVQDGARVQQLGYDPLGAVANEVTTMLVHNLNEETEQRLTFTTEHTYDGLGRTRTLTYPDGEVLTHAYDSGGLLSGVAGEKQFQHYAYVDRLEYDEFLDRRFQRTGNGVQTQYAYDADTRRLARQATDTPDREIQDLNYAYDRVGNVLAKANQLPAPVPELKGGPSTQTYGYDPYYRLRSAEGTYLFAPGKRRDYTMALTYDVNGNVTSKNQTDAITVPGGSKITQGPTTYNHKAIEFGSSKPHAITRIGRRPYTHDANGNFTGWTDDRSGQSRTVTWDATDRARSVANQGSTTRFAYDDTGRLAIERGPAGETSFVNQWYTVRNGSVAYKHIWAGEDRLAVQRAFDDGSYEHMRYFLHKDLQGSTDVVTDDRGLAFEWLEYFPSGETWVLEHSDVHRTPYLFGGGYLDEVRGLINLGARWYEPREQFMYSPDPVLQEEPDAVVDDPALLPAYSYAESNPLSLVDADGRAPSLARAVLSSSLVKRATATATQAVIRGAAARARGVGAAQPVAQPAGKARSSRLWAALESFAQSPRAKKLQAFSDRFDSKPLVEINLAKTAKGWALKDVKVSPTFGLKQFTVKTGAAGKPADSAVPNAAGNAAGDAAGSPGGGAAGGASSAAPSAATPPAGGSAAGGPPAPSGDAQQSSPPPKSSSP